MIGSLIELVWYLMQTHPSMLLTPPDCNLKRVSSHHTRNLALRVCGYLCFLISAPEPPFPSNYRRNGTIGHRIIIYHCTTSLRPEASMTTAVIHDHAPGVRSCQARDEELGFRNSNLNRTGEEKLGGSVDKSPNTMMSVEKPPPQPFHV